MALNHCRSLLHYSLNAASPHPDFFGAVAVRRDDLDRTFDDGKNVIEVMRNARRQRSHRAHLLTLQELLAGYFQLARTFSNLFLHFSVAANKLAVTFKGQYRK